RLLARLLDRLRVRARGRGGHAGSDPRAGRARGPGRGNVAGSVSPERFAAALPELFDDFPRSEHPRGRRFDDVIGAVPNLAMENNLALVNLAVSLLDPGESYVEAGTYMGASLIAAARGNEGADLVAIDNFRFGQV